MHRLKEPWGTVRAMRSLFLFTALLAFISLILCLLWVREPRQVRPRRPFNPKLLGRLSIAVIERRLMLSPTRTIYFILRPRYLPVRCLLGALLALPKRHLALLALPGRYLAVVGEAAKKPPDSVLLVFRYIFHWYSYLLHSLSDLALHNHGMMGIVAALLNL